MGPRQSKPASDSEPTWREKWEEQERAIREQQPKVDRETSPLAMKEEAAELDFMLENMRMKAYSSEGGHLSQILKREDNSGHEYKFEPVVLPTDSDGFVQSVGVDDTDGIRAFWDTYGLVVVHDVLTEEEAAQSVEELWDFMERHHTQLDRNDPRSWDHWPGLAKLGILGQKFVLSPQFCQTRQSPLIHKAFATLFGTDQLLVNVGRASAMRPTVGVRWPREEGKIAATTSEDTTAATTTTAPAAASVAPADTAAVPDAASGTATQEEQAGTQQQQGIREEEEEGQQQPGAKQEGFQQEEGGQLRQLQHKKQPGQDEQVGKEKREEQEEGGRQAAQWEVVDKPEWRTKAGPEWLHWDMNPFTGGSSTFTWRVKDPRANRGYQLAVQGLVALCDCGPADGGFFCVPGSHRVVRGWAGRNHDRVDDKAVLSPESSMQIYLPKEDPLKAHAQKVPIRRGCLLIWNSKLAHCNFPNESSRMRMIQYIQMARADDPAIGPLFVNEDLLPPRDDFDLTPLGRKLYGFDPW